LSSNKVKINAVEPAPVDSRGSIGAISATLAHMNAIGDQPFLGSRALRDGVLTPAQLRNKTWRRLLRDVYVRRDVEVDSRMRAQAVSLVLPDIGVVSGGTAAWLICGMPLSPTEPIEVTLPRAAAMKPRSGLLIRRALLTPDDIAMVSGVPVTTALRTGFDLARRRRPNNARDLVESVVAVDVLANSRRLISTELLPYAGTHPGMRGVRLVPEVVRLSDDGAESPMETRLRLVLVFGGLPRPVTQYEIRDRRGRFLARVDLAYPELKIAIEYDGEDHRDQWAEDIVRQNQVIGQGWTLMRYTKRDVYRLPGNIVAQVDTARGAALAA